jgi:pyruvate dehydrogenase E2 component (dihydrolipoamide acetyltransferase)
MAIELKIPELGENVTGGTVASVLVKIGDSIEKDQPLVELETEKAVLEVPAENGGIVKEILTKTGDEIQVGQTIVILDSNGASATPAAEPAVVETVPATPTTTPSAAPAPQATPTGDPSEVVIPELGENVTGGTVANLLVAVGDSIEKEQGLVELETEKAVLEVPSPLQGTIAEILVKAGDEVTIGQVIVKMAATRASAPAKAAPAQPVAVAQATAPQAAPQTTTRPAPTPTPAAPPISAAPAGKRPPAAAAPSVRRFAREIGVDIHDVPGTGPGKRISIEDVKAFSKTLHQQNGAKAATGTSPVAGPLPDFSKWGEIEREAMSKVRDKTAVHLSNAWATIPHVTQFDKADITEMEKLRKQYGAKTEQAGGKLTMTAILLKVAASALKVFPQFNASVDMASKEIIYKKYINIGVAVDTDRGLLVPVIRNVDQKNLTDLAIELTELAAKARDKKLTLDDMQGGNFTISNLGGIGGTYFTPIINSPEVAILGVSRGALEPVYQDNAFLPRLKLPLSLSYDHRVIDGANGARFIRWIVEALEQPFALILEG